VILTVIYLLVRGLLGDQFLGMFAEIENCMKLALEKRQNGRFMDLLRQPPFGLQPVAERPHPSKHS
jgi:hypothetical protein